MKIQETKHLLKKYYRGETSLQEEARLEAFFKAGDVPEQFLADRDMFSWRSMSRGEFIPDEDLERDIVRAVQQSEMRGVRETQSFRNQLYWLAGVAATMLIILGVYFGFLRSGPSDTFDDPEMAYLESKKILYYVSSHMNKGTQPVSSSLLKYGKGASGMQKIAEFNKAREGMEPVSRLPGGVNSLKYFDLLEDPAIMISKYTMK